MNESERLRTEMSTLTWQPSQTEVTRMIQRRLAHAENALRRTDLEAYPGESRDVYDRLLAECIGFASR
jgi:hypothetical protein